MTQGRQKPFLKTIVQAFKGKVSHKINVDSYFTNTEYILQKMFDSPGSETPWSQFFRTSKIRKFIYLFVSGPKGFH